MNPIMSVLFAAVLLSACAGSAGVSENGALQTDSFPSESRPLTSSSEAYVAYLRAMEVTQEGVEGPGAEGNRSVAQTHLDEALELDPNFARAHAWKANLFFLSSGVDLATQEDLPDYQLEMVRLAGEHADMALEIDPNIGLAHAIHARIHFLNGRDEPGRIEAEQALRLNPNDPGVLILLY